MNPTLSQRLLTMVIATILSLGTFAQEEVQWSHRVEMCPQGSEAVLVLTATIEPGWHLYDMDVVEDGPQATVISYDGSVGVEPQGYIEVSVESVKAQDVTYGAVIGFWEDSVTFSQRFTLTQTDAVIRGKVTFMACDDRNCLPPQSYCFSVDVTSPITQPAPVSLEDALRNLTDDDIETCCCIGWAGARK